MIQNISSIKIKTSHKYLQRKALLYHLFSLPPSLFVSVVAPVMRPSYIRYSQDKTRSNATNRIIFPWKITPAHSNFKFSKWRRRRWRNVGWNHNTSSWTKPQNEPIHPLLTKATSRYTYIMNIYTVVRILRYRGHVDEANRVIFSQFLP